MRKIMSILIILMIITSMAFATGSGDKTPAGPAKITVEIFDRGSDGGRSLAFDNAWTKWIHDKVLKDLNIDVTFQPVGRWSEPQDITNLMASNSAPDLCYTYNTAMITQFGDQGGILDLTPYIDRLLPDLKKFLGDDPALAGKDLIYRDRNPANNKIYSVPSRVINLPRRNTFIRKDWLDKLGLPIPKTTKEFHDALAAFRDRDPGNVGRNRVIPFFQGDDVRWGLANIIWSFFDPKISDKDNWIINWDSERAIALPGFKEGVRLMNTWYNEGLIYHDFPLMKVADDGNNILKSGVAGAFSGNWDLPYRTDYNINVELAKNVPGAEFVPCDPFQAADGKTWKSIADKPGLRIFVPANSKNPEAALKYLNWLAKYENYHYLQLGDVGVNHELVNGVPRSISRPANDPWIQNSQYNIDITMPINGIDLGSAELNARVLALGYGTIPSATIVNAYNLAIVNGKAPPVYQATSAKLGVYGQTLSDKVDALLAQAITATAARFDAVWDAGYRDYLSSGAQEVIDERRSLYK